jgi:hypothetical protein
MAASWLLTRITHSGIVEGHVQNIHMTWPMRCLLVPLQVQCDGCGAGDATVDGGVWWDPGPSCCQALLPNV